MKVVDLNLLIYSINLDSEKHVPARAWLEEVLNGDETTGLPWVVVLGFLRITTNPRVLPMPLQAEQALEIVEGWMARPNVKMLLPGKGHWRVFRHLIERLGTAGNLTADAHLAALAIESGCELCSADSDFARFPQLRWNDPTA